MMVDFGMKWCQCMMYVENNVDIKHYSFADGLCGVTMYVQSINIE